MHNALIILQIITAVTLSLLILVQSKGTGFGRSWGGSSSFTRRGLEKIVFKATFAVSAIFIVISIAQLAL